jgi:hypothetical protein
MPRLNNRQVLPISIDVRPNEIYRPANFLIVMIHNDLDSNYLHNLTKRPLTVPDALQDGSSAPPGLSFMA